MECKEVLTDGVLEEDPERIDWEGEGQEEGSGPAVPMDAPGIGRARAKKAAYKKKRQAARRSAGTRYSFDFRLRLVKMHVEEGITVRAIANEVGLSEATLFKWLSRYRPCGRAASRSPPR